MRYGSLIQIRLPEDEKVAWKKAADREQVTLSEWIRERCNGAEPRERALGTHQQAEQRGAVASSDDHPTAPTYSGGIAKARKDGDKYCPHGIIPGGRCARCG
jgi:hypothetical protein